MTNYEERITNAFRSNSMSKLGQINVRIALKMGRLKHLDFYLRYLGF